MDRLGRQGLRRSERDGRLGRLGLRSAAGTTVGRASARTVVGRASAGMAVGRALAGTASVSLRVMRW